MWSILDSGSGITAADHDVHFPGADLHGLNEKAKTFHSATGEAFKQAGNSGIPFKTQNNHDRQVTFDTAKVALHIGSMHDWNCQGHRTTLDEHTGSTLHLKKNEEDPVLVRSGVYFIKMFVKRDTVHGKPQPETVPPPPTPQVPRTQRPLKSALKRQQPCVRHVAAA